MGAGSELGQALPSCQRSLAPEFEDLDSLTISRIKGRPPNRAMATKVVAKTRSATSALRPEVQNTPHDVETTLKYYDDPGDGTPPTPVVIGG